MTRKIITATVALAVAVGLSACGGSADSPVVTQTVTASASNVGDSGSSTLSERDWFVILNTLWSQESEEDKANMCWGYNMEPDTMWESFERGASDKISRRQWETFMEASCN